jgi:hypothetical protein
MPSWNKYLPWVEYMVEGANIGSDQFMIALTDTTPVNTHSTLSQISAISTANIDSVSITTTSSSTTSGTHDLVFTDKTLTATGTVPQFRYVVVYDDTLAGDPVCGWWDYGSEVNMATGETFRIDFAAYTMRIS